jgi:preprotein translocase subunit SecY
MATPAFGESLGRAFKAGDLRRRILYTLGMFVVFRIGSHIPVPGVNPSVVQQLFAGGSLFGLLNLFAGGALELFAVFAMGIMPYINASIIMQLLTLVIPAVEQWSKEGPEGQKRITEWTRYGTIVLSVVQAVGLAYYLMRQGGFTVQPAWFEFIVVVTALTAGSTFLMWMGEQMTEYGIGNGISLLIFAAIVSRLPGGVSNVWTELGAGTISWFNVALLLVLGLLIIAAVIWVTEGARHVPVQYAKRVVGRRMYGGQSTHIPIKVNAAGVIPVIFAASILAFPLTMTQFIHAAWIQNFVNWFRYGGVWYQLVYAGLVIAFTFFYTAITFNPTDVADNIKKYGGFIPGLRPGRPTAQYLERVLMRVTVVGAIFLAAVVVLPVVFTSASGVPSIYFGGTSLLIVVGVALETMRQIEAQLLMRHYRGFMR